MRALPHLPPGIPNLRIHRRTCVPVTVQAAVRGQLSAQRALEVLPQPFRSVEQAGSNRVANLA
eukprot:1929171-Prymnesium_polylepis.1